MNTLIVKVCKYILAKNKFKNQRQKARAKVDYYKRLLAVHGNKITAEDAKARKLRGVMTWNKPGKKGELRLLVKKFQVEQLQAEIEMHKLVINSRKELNKIRKSMKYRLSHDADYITGIRIKDSANKFDLELDLEQIRSILMDEEVERIILGA